MDRIDISGSLPGGPKGKYFARASGTGFKALAADTGQVIELYDEIGLWGVTAKDFRDELKNATGDITVRINSPGGDVFDGIAMYNDLVAHKGKVRVEVVGLAASAASIVAMAGAEIAMAPNAFLMIHNAWVLAMGNRHDLTAAADVLGQIDEALARTYAGRGKVGIRAVRQMMDDETWLGAADAVDKGLADSVMTPAGGETAQARFDLSVFAHAPVALKWDEDQPGDPVTIRDIERELMRDAGPRSRSQARALVHACKNRPEDAMRDAGDEGVKRLLATIAEARTQLQPAQ